MLWSYTVAAMSDTTLVTMSSTTPRVTAQWLRPFVHSPTWSLVTLTLMKWKPKGSEALTSFWREYWGLCLLTPGAAITSEELVSPCEKTGTNGDLPSTWLHFRPAYLKYLHQWNRPSNKYKKYTQWIYNMRFSSAREGVRSGMRGFSSPLATIMHQRCSRYCKQIPVQILLHVLSTDELKEEH